jgi:hypothetical protein
MRGPLGALGDLQAAAVNARAVNAKVIDSAPTMLGMSRDQIALRKTVDAALHCFCLLTVLFL